MTALEIITLRAPALASGSNVNGLITLATEMTGTAFGAHVQQAIALRVLHWLTMEQKGAGKVGAGAGGMLSSESEGELSRSYNNASAIQYSSKYPDLTQTSFGAELIGLMNSSIFCPMNRTMENLI